MKLLKLDDYEKKQLKKLVEDQNLLETYHARSLAQKQHKSRKWDGYIHPSALSWNSSVDAQMKKLRKEFTPTPESLQRMEVGNVIHDYYQEKVDKTLFFGKSHMERHIERDDILFRGTPDQWGPTRHMGNVLLEFKSISSYQRDQKTADKLIKYVDAPAEEAEEIYKRLCIKYVDYTEPKVEHLTQVFTYAFIMKLEYGFYPDWVCIGYIRKETFKTMEFWYRVPEHKEYIQKAVDNYNAVLDRVIQERKK